MEKKVLSLEAKRNHVSHYGRRNNLLLSGIPDTVEDKDLESTVSSILSYIDVTNGPQEVKAWRRIGLSGKNKSKITIIRLVKRRHAKKALINRKKLESIDNAKYNFDGRTKIFINENLSPGNESIVYNCIKLKWAKVINSGCSRDGIICIKITVHSQPENLLSL